LCISSAIGEKMKRVNRRVILIGLLTLLCSIMSNVSFGDFEDLGVGARPIGMGSAFVALVDDVHSIYYNPAGLSQLTHIEFTSGYGKLYWGLDDRSNLGNAFIGYAHPLAKFGGIGVGWLSLGLNSLYREDTFIFSYGNRLYSSLSAGLTFKLLSKRYDSNEYTKSDPLFQKKGYSRTGFSGDLGLLYNFTSNISFGLSIKDIIQPNMDLEDKRDKVPLEVGIGVAYGDKSNLINFALDTTYKDGKFNISAGAEKWFSGKSAGVRGGMEIGSNGWKSFSLGGSYQVSPFEIDYAFIYPLSGLRGTYGSHRFSLTLRFGGVKHRLSEMMGSPPAETTIPTKPLTEEEKIEKMKTYYYRGVDYFKRGEDEAAIAEFEKVLELKPDHAQSLKLIERARERIKIKK